jgi:hypothetical protein
MEETTKQIAFVGIDFSIYCQYNAWMSLTRGVYGVIIDDSCSQAGSLPNSSL